MRQARRSTGMIVVVALLASGCTSGPSTGSDPASSSSSDASTAPAPLPPPAPQNSQQAYAGALAAYRRAARVTDAILRNGGRPVSRLESIASGEALKNLTATARNYARMRYRVVAEPAMTILRHRVTVDYRALYGNDVPYGQVAVYLCADYTRWDVRDAAGHRLPAPRDPRSELVQLFVWDTIAQAWLLDAAAVTGKDC